MTKYTCFNQNVSKWLKYARSCFHMWTISWIRFWITPVCQQLMLEPNERTPRWREKSQLLLSRCQEQPLYIAGVLRNTASKYKSAPDTRYCVEIWLKSTITCHYWPHAREGNIRPRKFYRCSNVIPKWVCPSSVKIFRRNFRRGGEGHLTPKIQAIVYQITCKREFVKCLFCIKDRNFDPYSQSGIGTSYSLSNRFCARFFEPPLISPKMDLIQWAACPIETLRWHMMYGRWWTHLCGENLLVKLCLIVSLHSYNIVQYTGVLEIDSAV